MPAYADRGAKPRRTRPTEHTYTIPPEELEAFQNAVDAGSIEENTLADW